MSVINLGRTARTNITFYQTDGLGRDGYITYNNAGFWKDKFIKPREIKHRRQFAIFRSLFHQTAPFKYQADGSGRDSYVLENYAGLVKPFEPLAKKKLADILRIPDESLSLRRKFFLNKTQRRYLNKIKKIQDGVISRLYNDSLEKIKKNNLECRTNSLNNFYTREKFRPLSGIMTPKIGSKNLSMSLNAAHSPNNYKNNLGENKEKLVNLKTNSHNKKNIFERFLKNNEVNNKEKNKMKIIKNLQLNSHGLKCDFNSIDMKNKFENNKIHDYDVNNSLSPNFMTDQNFSFGFNNKIQRKNKLNKINNNCFEGNNTFGSFSQPNRNKKFENTKSILKLKKRNNIKNYLLNNVRCVFSEGNKNNV